MGLDKKTIQKIADLAKLDLSDKEMLNFQKQLGGIIAYVKKINKLKLKNIPESLTGLNEEKPIWRDDEVKAFKGNHLNQGENKDAWLVVPKVLDK